MKKFLCLFVIFFIINDIDGIDEDFFEDLWKNLKPSTSKNTKKEKFGGISEETFQNANKMIKSEKGSENEMENTTPKLSQKIKKEHLEEKNVNLMTKIKEPKIELVQMSEESFENEFDEQADQNISSADQSNSEDDEEYKNMEEKTRNEMEIDHLNIFKKKELRKENVYKNLTNVQFESEIAKKLGTNRTEIYKLKRKLEQKREKRMEESKETKMELIRKFDEMKKEKIWEFKCDEKKRTKIEQEIANDLGISRDKIYYLKKELGLLNGFSNQQKLEKIEQFQRVKKEFLKKFNLKKTKKIDQKIAKKIGVGFSTIYKWRRKLGLITQKAKIYSDAEKLEFVKRSEEMTERNPMISGRKIAEKLGISNANLRRWTRKFGTKPIR